MSNKDNTIVRALIDRMFEVAGHDVKYVDLIGRTDEWYQQYTMTREQCDEWMKWGTHYIRTKKRCTKAMAEQQMAWFNVGYGLKIQESGDSVTK